MAVSTFTASTYPNSPKAVHVGDMSISGSVNYAGTIGDIIFLAKVPHGATIVDFWEGHTSGETAAAISFGFTRGVVAGGAGSASCLIASGPIAVRNNFNPLIWPGNWPAVISLSDLDPIRYTTLVAKAESGTFTISSTIRWCLQYRMDGPPRGGSEI